jgi:hypothetical protein
MAAPLVRLNVLPIHARVDAIIVELDLMRPRIRSIPRSKETDCRRGKVALR